MYIYVRIPCGLPAEQGGVRSTLLLAWHCFCLFVILLPTPDQRFVLKLSRAFQFCPSSIQWYPELSLLSILFQYFRSVAHV